MRPAQKCSMFFLTLAIVTLAGGVVFSFLVGEITSSLQNFMDEQLTLTPNNQGQLAFELWRSPTNGSNAVPIFMKFWFFNCTNPMEVAGGAKPNLTSVGPYIYREQRWRSNISWTPDGDVVSFGYHVNYTFDRDLTNSTLDPFNDTIWAPNIALAAINAIPWFPEAINMTYANATVSQQIITGAINGGLQLNGTYYWQYIQRHPNDVFGYNDTLVAYLKEQLGSFMPMPSWIPLIPNDNPLYFAQNSSVKTGKSKASDAGQFVSWAGMEKLPYWKSSAANTLNGTDGMTFSPDLTASSVSIFIDQAGRNLDMLYAGEEKIKGINTRRYNIDPNVYANSSVVPANSGYYQDATPSGVMNVSSFITATGPGPSPAFISQPYFLGADSSLTESLTMPRLPDASVDTAFLNIEPQTGQVLRAAKLLQVNILMWGNTSAGGLPGAYTTYNGSTSYLPYFVAEEGTEVTDHLASKMRMELDVVDTMHWVGIPVCFTLFVVFGILSVVCWRRGKRQDAEEERLLGGDTQYFGPNSQYTVAGKQLPSAYGPSSRQYM